MKKENGNDTVYWNNTRLFEAFAILKKKATAYWHLQHFGFFYFSDVVIAERLSQRMVDLGFFSYAKSCAIRYVQLQHPLPTEKRVNLNGLLIDQETGKSSLTFSFFWNCIFKFFFLWLRLLYYLLSALNFSGPSRKPPATLFFGLSDHSIFFQGTDARFVDFIKHGPVTPLTKSRNKIFYASKPQRSENDAGIIYHPLPIEALIKNNEFGFFQVTSLLAAHIKTAFLFFAAVARQRVSATLYADAVYSLLIQKMDRWNAIGDVLITNSEFRQYTWARAEKRNFVTHQVYYSQNIKPLVYKKDLVVADYAGYNNIAVDEIWVWTEDIGDYLQKLGFNGKVNVVGPILWYLPEAQIPKQENNFDVVIFDMMPISAQQEIELGVINNYYSTDNMFRYMEDIIEVTGRVNKTYGTGIRLLLKNKRPLHAVNDTQYADFISAKLRNGEITTAIDPQDNLFTLLSETRLSITVPFSSPTVVAAALNRPAVIYDFSGMLVNNYALSDNVFFISDKVALQKKIEQVFGLQHISAT